MRLAKGIIIDKEKTFEVLKFSALRHEVRLTNEDGSLSEEIKERTHDLKSKAQGRMIQVSIPASVPLSFLTKELIGLNADTIRSDIPTSSRLTDIKIWEVKDITKENEQGKTYNLIFGIEQLITDTDIQPTESSAVNETTDEAVAESEADSTDSETISENKSSSNLQEQNQSESPDSQANLENTGGKDTEQSDREKLINSTYSIEIYADGNKNMVITKNPTMSADFTKSAYEPKPKENIAIDNDKQAEILEFLETFFTLYPKATYKELSYYVKGNVLKPIGKDYIFSELINPVFYHEENGNISVSLAVKYLDEDTKMIQVFQY